MALHSCGSRLHHWLPSPLVPTYFFHLRDAVLGPYPMSSKFSSRSSVAS